MKSVGLPAARGVAATLLALALLPTHTVAQVEILPGSIGMHRLEFSARQVPTTTVFPAVSADARFLAVTEVFPESTAPLPFHYLVTGPGIAPFERHYSATGFGPVTYFLRVLHQPAGPLTLANLGPASAAPRILEVRAVTGGEMEQISRQDRFTLMGTVVNPQFGTDEEEQARRIAERLATDTGRNIDRAFSCEIYYACRNPDNVRQQIQTARERALKHGMPAFLFLVSWWAGTPNKMPDGKGGTFGDLRYQQICYTPGTEHPENPELREFLGRRYDPHYCLSVPNIWSNTPWLTMNSRQLNSYRAERMREAVELLKKICQGDTSWIAGIGLENEPRYWDTQATQHTPYHAGERWADFNPVVVEAAARDRVTLDPADGMSVEELVWLQKNAGRYFQETVDTCRDALSKFGLGGRFPLYTHTLQLASLFPGVKINQTPSDWALARGAHTGIEGFMSQPSDFDRVREWGPWCNLNREETDGRPIETHLWDLRTAYAMGSNLYNSFNWHAIKEDAYFNYARAFIAGLPVVTLPPATANLTAPDSLTFKPPGDLQAFSTLSVPVETIAGAGGGTVALSVDGGPHRTWFSERQPLPPGGGPLTFVFPVPAEVPNPSTGTLRLRTYAADGTESHDMAVFAENAAQDLRLSLDLGQSRTLSLLVINWRRVAPQ